MNVWDMTYGVWLTYAAEADAWVEAVKKNARKE